MKRLVLLTLVALWGCGSSGASTPAPTTPSQTTTTTPTTPTPSPIPVGPTIPVPYVAAQLNLVLGRPTATSIAASVLADAGTAVYLEYGTTSGTYTATTTAATVTGTYPVVITLTGLTANTRYFYRARYRAAAETTYRAEPERYFQTQRNSGSTYTFGVQGDSHPERANSMFNTDLYTLNMKNVASRLPDFYLALGDDFSVENLLTANQLSQTNVDALYRNQRNYFALMGHSTPVYLVNGNHEQAAQYLLNGRFITPYGDAPIFQGKARVGYFPLPAPDGFYTGDTQEVTGVGLPRDYYAWEWGDALFVTIDPYWHSSVPVDNGVPGVNKTSNTWDASIGDEQYAWLKRTLESSHAKYKFVFEHHVLGTFRGAAGIVHEFEWGGYDRNGTAYQFASNRPTWAKPIHQLMNDTGVTIFFSGHDHLYAREKVDNVIYQEVPNPADNTYTAFNADAYMPSKVSLPGAKYDPGYGVVMGDAGHLLVTVAPDQVTVAYVRAVLPGDEAKAGGANNVIAFSYTIK